VPKARFATRHSPWENCFVSKHRLEFMPPLYEGLLYMRPRSPAFATKAREILQ